MWFLIPSPYRVARALTPRRRSYRRSCPHQADDNLSFRGMCLLGFLFAGLFGLLLLTLSTSAVHPGQMPPGVSAPYGWYTDTDGYLEPVTGVNVPPVLYPKAKDSHAPLGWTLLLTGGTGLLLLGATRKRKARTPKTPPASGEQAPPIPDEPLRRGPVPVNRELPMDRPHPWRTWEG